jgi:hypothetical protein
MNLSKELYIQCFKTLLRCREFESYDSLQALFITHELNIARSRLPRANDKENLVSQTVACLLQSRLSDGRSVFPEFLGILQDLRQPSDALHDALGKLRTQVNQELQKRSESGVTDIPFVIVAMTRDQANALMTATALDCSDVDERTRCEKFKEALKEHGIEIANLPDSYGEAREEWKPPISQGSTIYEIVWDTVERINAEGLAVDSPRVRPSFWSAKFFDEETSVATWNDLRQSGCVIIVDAVSMFHPQLCQDFLASGIDLSEHVAMLVLSPVNSCEISVNELIEREICERMKRVLSHFRTRFNKRYEFSTGNLLTLQRWLSSILPGVTETVQRRRPTRSSLELVQEQVGPELGMGDFLFGRRGG